MSSKPYTPDLLLEKLESLPKPKCYWVAYSGGLDSHVLLHSIVAISGQLQGKINAIHVNHHINKNSHDWESHCKEVCDGLGIKLKQKEIKAHVPRGASVEAWAREQRYEVFKSVIDDMDMLLTAQHQDDQAETLLLQLFRGAGSKGLSAMPDLRKFGRGWHARPFLNMSRADLECYAVTKQLCFVEDDSNNDLAIDRNYLRLQIIPELTRRWPGLNNVLSRSASHLAESSVLQDELADMDMKTCSMSRPEMINLDALKILSQPRQKNILRYWLRGLAFPMPSTQKMKHVLSDIINSAVDANPCVHWQETELRRYRNIIYVSKPLSDFNTEKIERWDLKKKLKLPLGELQAVRGKGQGLKISVCVDSTLEVRFRTGGEVIKIRGHQNRKELKKLFQENNVPPWYRERIPLLYTNKKLAMVAGFWIDEECYAENNDDAWQITWTGYNEIPIESR